MTIVPAVAAWATRAAAVTGEVANTVARSGAVTPTSASRVASVASGAPPGRKVTVRQLRGSPGKTPAWTNELLPVPDGPTTTCSGRCRSRSTNALTSASRPTNRLASLTAYGASPG